MITKRNWAKALRMDQHYGQSKDRWRDGTFPAQVDGWIYCGLACVRAYDAKLSGNTNAPEGFARGARRIVVSAIKATTSHRNIVMVQDGPKPANCEDKSMRVVVLRNGRNEAIGIDGRLWPLLEGYTLYCKGARFPVVAVDNAGLPAAIVMPRLLDDVEKQPAGKAVA